MAEKKKKPPAKPNYGYLNQDWAGPDTDRMAAARAMWNLPGGGPGAFTPGNFGHPPGSDPGPNMFNQSSTWHHTLDGWEIPYEGPARRNIDRATQAGSAALLRRKSPAYTPDPDVTPDLVNRELARMVKANPNPGPPLRQQSQQRTRRRRNDRNLLNEVTQQQSMPTIPLSEVLWGNPSWR